MRKYGVLLASIALLLVWLLPVRGYSQGAGAEKLARLMKRTTPQQRARFEDHWMKRDLNLTNEQTAKVGDINLRSAERMQSIFGSPEGKIRKAQEVMRVRREKDNELRSVLTGEQFTKYEKKKEAMWQKMHEMR